MLPASNGPRLVLPSATVGADLRGASDSVGTGGAAWAALRCGIGPVSGGLVVSLREAASSESATLCADWE